MPENGALPVGLALVTTATLLRERFLVPIIYVTARRRSHARAGEAYRAGRIPGAEPASAIAISQSIVSSFGGTIGVESAEGRGSAFRLLLNTAA